MCKYMNRDRGEVIRGWNYPDYVWAGRNYVLPPLTKPETTTLGEGGQSSVLSTILSDDISRAVKCI